MINSHSTATSQVKRVIRVGILNLMPMKEVTESDFERVFCGIERPVEIIWLRLRSYVPRHTSAAHMDSLYVYWDEISSRELEGLIITGAPVELMPFEEVAYWSELTRIFDWSQTNVLSTIYICWAAQAGLYYFHDIPKYSLSKKKFGIFSQTIQLPLSPLFKGFAGQLMMPHSRHTEIRQADVESVKSLQIAALSSESGVSMVFARNGRDIFITGHMEYASDTLHNEYHRDLGKRDDVDLPEHYYELNDPQRVPLVSWQEDTTRFYQNWVDSLSVNPRPLELLAPAKNLACGKAAIDHGADAVYIGAEHFGAREAAGNSVEDIAELCRYAHQFGSRVYVTVNTIIYDDELYATRLLLLRLKEAGVDAVLIQDMALLELCREVGLNIHASTQTDNRTKEKVAWLRSLGIRRVVLARELSIKEIREIHESVPDVELEVFVHGALCVSYSGLCYASQYCFGRSANRGTCAQFCRMKFDLIDADGHEVIHQRHLLSLKDMCRINRLKDLAESGAVSFKIEGRLKDIDYVKNVTAAYSQQLDKLIAGHPADYSRSSQGIVSYTFEPHLEKTFNRGFTNYFLDGRKSDISSFDTPKALGEYVGRVKELCGKSVKVSSAVVFSNGDGLCFFNQQQELQGFRVNRVEGNNLFLLQIPAGLTPGTPLYRNNDVAFERLLSMPSATRKIPLCFFLDIIDEGFVLTASTSFLSARSTITFEHQTSRTSQYENICRQLSKLGDTPYKCVSVEVSPDAAGLFIPSSLLSDMRRQVVLQLMERQQVLILPVKVDQPQAIRELYNPPSYTRYTYLYNIANNSSRLFYASQGIGKLSPAFEVHVPDEAVLMQCRHCLRFALGYCIKHGGQQPRWREPLHLRLGDGRLFRLEFDCAACQMNVHMSINSSIK